MNTTNLQRLMTYIRDEVSDDQFDITCAHSCVIGHAWKRFMPEVIEAGDCVRHWLGLEDYGSKETLTVMYRELVSSSLEEIPTRQAALERLNVMYMLATAQEEPVKELTNDCQKLDILKKNVEQKQQDSIGTERG